MAQPTAHILVVEDETRYLRAIQINLEASGYQVSTEQNGLAAVEAVAAARLDLVLLDIKLPGLDGLEVCRRVREFSDVPIIMLTAKAQDADKVRGLDAGADDYVIKPFSVDVLLARVRAALRRAELSGGDGVSPVMRVAELKVDLGQQRVFISDQEVELTPTEYRLLSTMVKQAGRVLTPEYLLEQAWGVGYEGETQVVWQAMHRLRRKIERDPKDPQYIQTRSGVGYIFCLPE